MNQTRHPRARTATLLALSGLAVSTTACDSDASNTAEVEASESFCADAEALRQAFVNIFTTAPAGDPEQLQAVVTAGREAVTEMIDRAPEAVDEAVRDSADILNRLDHELAERAYDVDRLHADGASPIEDDAFDDAGEDIEHYLTQQCGVPPLDVEDDE